MATKFDHKRASDLLREIASEAYSDNNLDRDWNERVRHLSELCRERGSSKTHLAFLCTAMLAKSLSPSVDLFAVKPSAVDADARAYSARGLCHAIVVPLAAELGFDIGVSGREPLNNQPYFRMQRLDDGTPVRSTAQHAFAYTVELVRELGTTSQDRARVALREFIRVRRGFVPTYSGIIDDASVTPQTLTSAISRFVGEDSEGGKRAQAIVAALFDVVFGEDRVDSGMINDPSRRSPGDVCVRLADDSGWEKSIEVRDKPVTPSDVLAFVKRCVDAEVYEAALVAVAPGQAPLATDALTSWCDERGVGVTVFVGWNCLVQQCTFWASDVAHVAAGTAVVRVQARLAAIGVPPASVDRWMYIVTADGRQPE